MLATDAVEEGDDNDTITRQILWHATPREGLPQVLADSRLIPLYGHRMIPSNRCAAGNPVFSMHGCYDNIIYGSNFWEWLVNDFAIVLPPSMAPNTLLSTPMENIPFCPPFIDTWMEGTTTISTEEQLQNGDGAFTTEELAREDDSEFSEANDREEPSDDELEVEDMDSEDDEDDYDGDEDLEEQGMDWDEMAREVAFASSFPNQNKP